MAVSRLPRHTQGSYLLTVVQAPGASDDSSSESSQCRKGGDGGGLEVVYFPAVIPIPTISSLPEGSAQWRWGGVGGAVYVIAQPPARGAACLGQPAICVLFSIPTSVSPALWPICPIEGEVCRQRDAGLPVFAVSLTKQMLRTNKQRRRTWRGSVKLSWDMLPFWRLLVCSKGQVSRVQSCLIKH